MLILQNIILSLVLFKRNFSVAILVSVNVLFYNFVIFDVLGSWYSNEEVGSESSGD